MRRRKISGMIGLAEKAGKLSSGEFSSEKAIEARKAKLCILASDASDNTKKHFTDMCLFRDIRVIDSVADKESLGHMIGKKDRSVITIDDAGFSDTILKLIEGGRTDGK